MHFFIFVHHVLSDQQIAVTAFCPLAVTCKCFVIFVSTDYFLGFFPVGALLHSECGVNQFTCCLPFSLVSGCNCGFLSSWSLRALLCNVGVPALFFFCVGLTCVVLGSHPPSPSKPYIFLVFRFADTLGFYRISLLIF